MLLYANALQLVLVGGGCLLLLLLISPPVFPGLTIPRSGPRYLPLSGMSKSLHCSLSVPQLLPSIPCVCCTLIAAVEADEPRARSSQTQLIDASHEQSCSGLGMACGVLRTNASCSF